MSVWPDHKEVVRINAKKTDGMMQPEYKKMCVDPQLTSYEMLQNLLARAFDITSDFTISYLATDDTGENVYLSLLSDWDLDAAFISASNPCLRLKVDLKPFEPVPDDWDLVKTSDVRKMSPTHSLLTTSNMIIGSLTKTVSSVTKAIGLRQEEAAVTREMRPPSKPPMCDAEFHTFLDAVGCLIYPQQFRLAVYQSGVEPSLRKVVWRHLLNVYPGSLNGRERFDYLRRKSNEYFHLRDEWQARQSDDVVRVVAGMVRKDVLRTDRLHPFYAGENNANGTSLFNLLVTFAVTHPRLSYWQGMSDIASPILAVEADEATAYVCFCALMRRLAASFAGDGVVMTARFEHLISLLRHFDRALYSHICRCGADDMFFTYRWLLLEMKREFPLDDAMYALEVMWSSLPIAPPDDDLPLFDPAFREATIPSPAPASQAEAYVHLRSYQRRISSSHSHAAICNSSEAHNASMNGTESDKDDVLSSSKVTSEQEDSTECGMVIKRGQLRQSESTQAVQLRKQTANTDVEEPDEQTSLLTTGDGASIGFVKVSHEDVMEDRLPPLPPPSELGCGNPFLMFLCLSTLILQRDAVMSSCHDYNDIAMYYDKMVRQHRVGNVVHYARQLYATYLRELQQQQKNFSDEVEDKPSAVANRI